MKNNYSIIPKVLASHPGTAAKLTLGFFRQAWSKSIDYNFSNGKARNLSLVTFKITPLCNLRCVMCGQRGETGTLKGAFARNEAAKIVPHEKYEALTLELQKKASVFYIWGGEPFMYPDFMDLAGFMAKKIPALAVNTNGTFLEENAERIVKDQWTAIFISLDSFQEENDAMRGKGSYNKVMAGIEAVNREKNRQKLKKPYLGIVSTISNLNYRSLDKLAYALKDKGLSWHIINLGTYTTAEYGKAQEKFMRDNFDVKSPYWQGFASRRNEGIDGDEFKAILSKVHEMDNGYPIITVPVIRPSKIGAYYADLNTLVRDRCTAPWFSVDINYDGGVHFCADYPDYYLGNIKDTSILEIFNNDRAVKFRKLLKSSPDGLFPGCRRCYQLMLCGRRIPGF